MFPTHFTDKVVEVYTNPGDYILDPFAGRASSVFSAATRGRYATGIEINPVGWLYGRVKLAPASSDDVEQRLAEMARAARALEHEPHDGLPKFFQYCFSAPVLRFLWACRQELDWMDNPIDCTLMTFILIYLHGKRSASLSNQMRQTKAMSPQYSVQWWEDRHLTPPELNPEEFLKQRIRWRYSKGVPRAEGGEMLLGDSCQLMQSLEEDVAQGKKPPVKLLFTSPPYYGLTNYHYDQWLRLWMLGGPAHPTYIGDPHKARFESQYSYKILLESVFQSAARVMDNDGCVYVRTGAQEFTLSTTLSVLSEAFPNWEIGSTKRPFKSKTQTALFGDSSSKPGEVDIILKPDLVKLGQIEASES